MKAFEVYTKDTTYGSYNLSNLKYIVFANDYGEVETVFRNQISQTQTIESIHQIDCNGTACACNSGYIKEDALEEVGSTYGLSKEHVRQIIEKALLKMKVKTMLSK